MIKHATRAMSHLTIITAMAYFGFIGPAMARASTRPDSFWTDEIEQLFARLPIQDQGRIKPLSTYALFRLVSLSGRTTLKDAAGDRLSPTRWLMDTLFFHEVASDYKVFRIENPGVMQALGLPDARKRSYFSIRQIRHVQGQLIHLARDYSKIDEEERTLQQKQILNLYGKFADYDRLLHALQFASANLKINPDGPLAEELAKIDPEMKLPERFTDWTAALPKLLMLDRRRFSGIEDAAAAKLSPAAAEELDELMGTYETAANAATALTIFPPISDRENKQWYSIRGLVEQSAMGALPAAGELEMAARLESLPGSMTSPRKFTTALTDLVDSVTAAARDRGEAKRLGLEVFFYKLKPFRWSLAFYILSFLVVAVSWLAPGREGLNRAAIFAMIPPTALLIFGITIRCILRGRPPVSTLYETTLFIPAVAIVVALIAEWINRKRIAIALASALGVIGLFMANIYELKDGQDTMGRLVAVLNSNFWLSTHVTTITIGYSAGLLAAALAHIYIFARAFGLSSDRSFFRSIARMVYGVVCFGAVLSLVGTALGGIWANYSWGRFWGWDPKENGALLIVLWNLIILHGRNGGYIRDLGMCMAAVFGGMVVAFSWWGVNMLGVGLHSYGFISGIMKTLTYFYVIEAIVVLIGVLAFRVENKAPVRAKAAGRPGSIRGRIPRQVKHLG